MSDNDAGTTRMINEMKPIFLNDIQFNSEIDRKHRLLKMCGRLKVIPSTMVYYYYTSMELSELLKLEKFYPVSAKLLTNCQSQGRLVATCQGKLPAIFCHQWLVQSDTFLQLLELLLVTTSFSNRLSYVAYLFSWSL